MVNLINILASAWVIFILSTHTPAAISAELPIITLSVGSPYASKNGDMCGSAYNIKIFENGHVEYHGVYRVLTHGTSEYEIDKQALRALIKKFQDAKFLTKDNRAWLPSLVREKRAVAEIGIQFRQGNQKATMLNGLFDEPLSDLIYEILKATKAEQWGVSEAWGCSSSYSRMK